PRADHFHAHLRQSRLRCAYQRISPDGTLAHDGYAHLLTPQLPADLCGDVGKHREHLATQIFRLGRSDTEPVLVGIVVVLHAGTELAVRGADAQEDLLIVHCHVLHGEHGLATEAADEEI